MYGLLGILLFRLRRHAIDARRTDRTWRYLAWSFLSATLTAIVVSGVLFAALVLLVHGLWWLALPVLMLLAIPVAQHLTVRHVLVPLGAVRTAFWVGHFATMQDSDAYGLVCAAWAHAHRPDPRDEAWLIARRDKRKPLGDAEVVVTALIAAARGDADTARLLMRSTLDLVEVHPTVRELVGEWLACDAAERGAWHELAADASAARFPATSLTYFLEGVAARRIGAAAAPNRAALLARWALAPYHRFTFAYLATPAGVTEPIVEAVATLVVANDDANNASEAAPLSRAVAAHVALLNRGTSAVTLAATTLAWDAALADPATRLWVATRALELGCPGGAADRALREVAKAVTEELGDRADAAAHGPPASRGAVGDALARRLRHGRLDALEAGFSRWEDRRRDGAYRASIDEWREWMALRGQYDAAVRSGGADLRRLAFPHAYKMGNSMAAWLWNTRNEYALAHAVFAWLLGEAMLVGDSEALDVLTRNSRIAVNTRTGRIQFPATT